MLRLPDRSERLFVVRAMWFAREFVSALPSFDQNVAIAMRTLSLIALFAASVQAACTRARAPGEGQPAVPPKPAQTASVLPPETDLTGNWATGTGPAPATATITLYPECTHHPAVWVLKQTDNSIEAWAFAESYDQGVAAKGPGVARKTGSAGLISGLDVTIDDDQYHYRLQYDPQSKQLRGTRNGSPFWAARQNVVRTRVCPGVP